MRELLEKRRVFIAILALGLFAASVRNVTDPDFWWHLRTGQLILQNHAVFHADPYSFTRFGQPWINHEWLSDVLIFGLYRLAGFGGLIVFFGVVTTVIFVLTFLRCAGNPSVALAITAWAAFASAPLWGARPGMFSLLLISLFLVILERADKQPRLLWWLPPLIVLWANLHAGYAAGIGLILAFLAGDALDSALGRAPGPLTAARTKKLALVLLACLVLVPLNPYGWKLYGYPLATLHSKAMQSHIAEWFSPDFHQPQYWPALFLILTILLALGLAPRVLRSCELILLLTTMYMSLRSQRHLAIFAIVAAPVLSRLVDAWRRKHKMFSWLSGHAYPQAHRSSALINGSILLILAMFAGFRVHYLIGQQPAAEAARFPAAAATFLAVGHLPGPIFNYYDWGGYFIWKLYPEYPVYIDGRADLYGDSFMDQFSADYACRADCGRDSLDAWRIRTIILPPQAPLIAVVNGRNGWKQIYSDSQAIILSRTLNKSVN